MALYSMPGGGEYGSEGSALPESPVLTHEPLIGAFPSAKTAATPPRKLPHLLSARLERLAPPDPGLKSFLNRIDRSSAIDNRHHSHDIPLRAPHRPDAPGFSAADAGPFAPMEMRAFAQQCQRRQRKATLLVAGCVAVSFMLTALALITTMGVSAPSNGAKVENSQTSSIGKTVMPAQQQAALGAGGAIQKTKPESPAIKILASP